MFRLSLVPSLLIALSIGNAYSLLSHTSAVITSHSDLTRSTTTTNTRSRLFAELGELSAPKALPLDPDVIKAAASKLRWELQSNNVEADGGSDWQDGSLWAVNRLQLVELWVLPRDMSNGADSRYAVAASKSEVRMLEKVPQLLRCPTVVAAAKTALSFLPPAILRNEPALLVYPPESIQGGMTALKASLQTENASNNDQLIEVCRDTPSRLFDAIEAYMAQTRPTP